MKKLILPLVLGTMIFTSCEQKAEKAAAFDIEAVKKDVEDWQVNFETIVKNKDSVGFANLFAEDAVRMAPNAVSTEGRANIQKSVVEPFKFIGTTNLTLGDAMGDENTITTYGTYEHFTPDGTSLDKGKYMGVFKRVDGKLIAIRDIWNSDLAPAAPAAPATK
ncbi:YybH family protein [Aquirufa lenticrescens]|jgi:ketosteroid isomerase-like protein|uniref:YybH family protein n=1 Tax=Aquirufa lenticrescens TaxID=2696560 RepID=UPI001CAA7F90|nr:nuclear transport factor 2 family protein [Aquirufa lenticrescens]UAJ13600.1 SnoaL-like domain-containing protein [Aquirufa lenticrescens]